MDSAQEQSIRRLAVCRGMRIEIAVDGHIQTWDVVGHGRSDTVRKLISCDTPLIQLIWGMEVGETIKGQFGSRELNVEIRNISNIPKKDRIW